MSRRSTSRSLLATLLIFLAGIITIGILYTQFFTLSYPITNDSLSPTLTNGTTVIVNNKIYADQRPKRGEIVLVNTSENAQTLTRIVGLPSETVKIQAGVVYINAIPLDEPYASGQLAITDSITLDAQSYLFLIDDRANATPLILTQDQLIGPALWVTGGQLPLAAVRHHLYQ